MYRGGFHFGEFIQIVPEIALQVPMINMYAYPPSYGQSAFDKTQFLMDFLSEKSKYKIDFKKVDGSHHFHMIKPKETAELIFKFLDSYKDVINVKAKL
jgi:hypothetical protein